MLKMSLQIFLLQHFLYNNNNTAQPKQSANRPWPISAALPLLLRPFFFLRTPLITSSLTAGRAQEVTQAPKRDVIIPKVLVTFARKNMNRHTNCHKRSPLEDSRIPRKNERFSTWPNVRQQQIVALSWPTRGEGGGGGFLFSLGGYFYVSQGVGRKHGWCDVPKLWKGISQVL